MFHAYCLIGTHSQEAFITSFLAPYSIHALDILTVATSPITINQIREVKRFLVQGALVSQYKAVIINGNYLTPEAQQALLKTLEEPPPKRFIFIHVTSEDILLPTLISRSYVHYLEDKSQVAQETIKEAVLFWNNLHKSSIGKRFTDISVYSKDREVTLNWIKEQITILRAALVMQIIQPLTADKTTYTTNQIAYIVRLLNQTYTKLQANISLKLVLDQLMLEVPFQN